MSHYREVHKLTDQAKPDPGRIFYTIRADDAGLGTIKTTEGPIHVSGFMGRVQPQDAGKRLYRVPVGARPDDYRVRAGKLAAGEPADWIWQVESNAQRDARLTEKRFGLGPGPLRFYEIWTGNGIFWIRASSDTAARRAAEHIMAGEPASVEIARIDNVTFTPEETS